MLRLEKDDILIFRNREFNIQPLYTGDWELGRQTNALYTKARITMPRTVLQWLKKIYPIYSALDSYHLKIQSNIPYHKDDTGFVDHYRFNINARGSYWMNIGDRTYLLEEGDSCLFRSDISEHGVDLFENKSIEIFSIGIFIGRE